MRALDVCPALAAVARVVASSEEWASLDAWALACDRMFSGLAARATRLDPQGTSDRVRSLVEASLTNVNGLEMADRLGFSQSSIREAFSDALFAWLDASEATTPEDLHSANVGTPTAAATLEAEALVVRDAAAAALAAQITNDASHDRLVQIATECAMWADADELEWVADWVMVEAEAEVSSC